MVQANIRKSYQTKGRRLVIAYIHPGNVSSYFLEGMLGTVLFDDRHEQRVQTILQDWSSANVSQSRNKLTSKFLDEYDAEWLLWIDADMGFAPDDVYKIMSNADPVRAPIVGGLCFGGDNGALFPTIYQIAQLPSGELVTDRQWDYEADAMVQVAATGAAFLLIHRSALVKIRDAGFNKTFPFFQETEWNGRPVGEDLTFCLRAGKLGLPVWVDTRVKIGHHKSTVFTENLFRAQRAAVKPEE